MKKVLKSVTSSLLDVPSQKLEPQTDLAESFSANKLIRFRFISVRGLLQSSMS